MQGVGEVHAVTHPLNRGRYRARILAYEVGQCDQSNKSISDAIRSEAVEPAQNPLGFKYDRLCKQDRFAGGDLI